MVSVRFGDLPQFGRFLHRGQTWKKTSKQTAIPILKNGKAGSPQFFAIDKWVHRP